MDVPYTQHNMFHMSLIACLLTRRQWPWIPASTGDFTIFNESWVTIQQIYWFVSVLLSRSERSVMHSRTERNLHITKFRKLPNGLLMASKEFLKCHIQNQWPQLPIWPNFKECLLVKKWLCRQMNQGPLTCDAGNKQGQGGKIELTDLPWKIF